MWLTIFPRSIQSFQLILAISQHDCWKKCYFKERLTMGGEEETSSFLVRTNQHPIDGKGSSGHWWHLTPAVRTRPALRLLWPSGFLLVVQQHWRRWCRPAVSIAWDKAKGVLRLLQGWVGFYPLHFSHYIGFLLSKGRANLVPLTSWRAQSLCQSRWHGKTVVPANPTLGCCFRLRARDQTQKNQKPQLHFQLEQQLALLPYFACP